MSRIAEAGWEITGPMRNLYGTDANAPSYLVAKDHCGPSCISSEYALMRQDQVTKVKQ